MQPYTFLRYLMVYLVAISPAPDWDCPDQAFFVVIRADLNYEVSFC